ncbi:MAG: class II glutamine amidotransferase [Erysipelotrichaceae bacterium]|nr:class II glutamine amidotransferase [Erysipelotrichaceae bacterium]
MCELFGYTGKTNKVLNPELETFFSHSVNHPDGWGLALMDRQPYEIDKESVAAFKSEKIHTRLQKTICAKNVLAHIRLATIGTDEYENTHPFTGQDSSGRYWILIHNGTIFESDVLHPYLFTQTGSTDSERVFLYLLDQMNDAIRNKGRSLTDRERFILVEQLVKELSFKNKLNLLIYDGRFMYVHTNCRDSLYARHTKDGITFATTPLSKKDWKALDINSLSVYRRAQKVYQGSVHENEYIPDEKSIQALYLAYAGL